MAYLNKNTFEVVDNIIEIDDRMVPIIQELNTKGYKTVYCCSGHESLDNVTVCPIMLPKEQYNMIIPMIDEEYVELGEYEGNKVIATVSSLTNIYITFSDIYSFEYVPEGFDLEIGTAQIGNENKNFCSLRKIISLYKDEDNKIIKSEEELASEIDEANQELLAWAKSLEPTDEMKLKREK